MKIQNIVRIQAMTIGFAAALLLASSAPAQEIDNPEWDSPNVTPFAQQASAPAASDLNLSAADSQVSSYAPITAAPAAQATLSPSWLFASFLVSMALAALRALVMARRSQRNSDARVGQVTGGAALS